MRTSRSGSALASDGIFRDFPNIASVLVTRGARSYSSAAGLRLKFMADPFMFLDRLNLLDLLALELPLAHDCSLPSATRSGKASVGRAIAIFATA
jgi:hypothetical protein